MDVLFALGAVGAFAVLVWLFGRWTRRRANELETTSNVKTIATRRHPTCRVGRVDGGSDRGL